VSRLIHIGTEALGGRTEIDLDHYGESGLRVGIFGSSGAGKGYLLGVIIEDMIAAGVPTIMLDAEHELWTFKEVGALVIGGAEGDAPFIESAPALDAVIRYALDTTTPIVFDVGEQAEAEESEAARLGELVMRRLWSVLDRHRTESFFAATEASIFAPQQVPRGTHLPAMMRQMFQRGRKRGLMIAVETQRMADIQKAVISQSNVSFYGRINKFTDYRAVERELDGRPYDLMRGLRSGTFYATPAGVEVNVRPRRVTHGGGGPGAQIVIHERERVGLDEVLRLLREGAAVPEVAVRAAHADAAAELTDVPRVLSRVRDESQDREVTDLRVRLAEAEAAQAILATTEAERARLATLLAEARSARSEADAAAEAALAELALLRDRAETLDALAGLLRRLVGDSGGARASALDDLALRRLVRDEIERFGVPNGRAPVVPVEALRQRYLEAAAQRLVARVAELDPEQRATLLFLLAHPEGGTINSITIGITGSASGGTRSRYSKAVAALIAAGLVRQGGEGRMKRWASVEEWVRAGLGPHEATDEEVGSVRDRATALLVAAEA
jgi:hypothetical protein